MVAQPRRDRRDEISRAASAIEQHGGRVIGLVANCWDLKCARFANDGGIVPCRTTPSQSFAPQVLCSDLSDADNVAIVTGRSGTSLT